jgi:hypothetical protein
MAWYRSAICMKASKSPSQIALMMRHPLPSDPSFVNHSPEASRSLLGGTLVCTCAGSAAMSMKFTTFFWSMVSSESQESSDSLSESSSEHQRVTGQDMWRYTQALTENDVLGAEALLVVFRAILSRSNSKHKTSGLPVTLTERSKKRRVT